MSKLLKRVVLSAFLISTVLLSAVCVEPATASEFQRQLVEARRYRLRGEIGIFYDPFDALISQTARDVFAALDMANVSSSLHEVSSVFELERSLNKSGVWIAVYLFNSDLDGVTMGLEVTSWRDFAQILLRYKKVHHILGIGNTRKLAEYVGENCKNIHLANTDLVDAKLTFLYSLWSVAEVLESSRDYRHREAEVDIRRVGLKFFADNFNDLFERTLEPKNPLGEEDLDQKRKDFEKLKERFPRTVRELPPIRPGEATPNEEGYSSLGYEDFSSVGNWEQPLIRLVGEREDGDTDVSSQAKTTTEAMGVAEALGSSSYASGQVGVAGATGSDVRELLKILDIPTKSGLDGPIGTVVDLLIDVLIEVGGYASVAVDPKIVDDLKAVAEAIKSLVGLVKGEGDGKSALKALFDVIKRQFPALEEYEKFFDLFVDALFALRGGLPEIVDWVREALCVLLDELGLAEGTRNAIKWVLTEILDLDQELFDIIKGSENVFVALLSWFMEKIVPKIIDKFLSEASARFPGLFPDRLITRAQAAEKISSILNAIVNFVISSDSAALLDKLVSSVFDVFGFFEDLGWAGVSRIVALIKLVSGVLGYSDPIINGERLLDALSVFLRTWAITGGWPLWIVDPATGEKLIETGIISDTFGSGRDMDDDDAMDEFHEGVDIAASEGTAVFSVGDGRVSYVNAKEEIVDVEEWVGGVPTGQTLEYVHVTNIKVAVNASVNSTTRLADIAEHPVLDHLHFGCYFEEGKFVNPLRPDGPIKDKDTIGLPTVPANQIYLWHDDANPIKGDVDASGRFVAGKIDIVARAYDPTGVKNKQNQIQDAGVMQLLWKVDSGRVKYIIRDGQWDGAVNNAFSPRLFKEVAPADTDDDKQEYFYIITNTKNPENGGPNDLDKGGYWNTKLKKGQNELWNGVDATSNAEAQYPDGYHIIWIRAGSDRADDLGTSTPYWVQINNFEQTVESSNKAGTPKNDFTNEPIYIYGKEYAPNRAYKAYVFAHGLPWGLLDGANLTALNPTHTRYVTLDTSGIINQTLWEKPTVGQWDIVVDYDGDGKYSTPRFTSRISIDALDTTVNVTSGVAASQSSTILEEEPPILNSEPALVEPYSSSYVEPISAPTTSTNTYNLGTLVDPPLEDALRNLADQIMAAIKDAVEEGKTEVRPFKEQIRGYLDSAIEKAGLTVSDSTRRVIVDSIVLVAGVMNSNFTKESLPTLLTVTRGILEDLSVPAGTIDTIEKVVTSIMSIAATIKEDNNLKQIISGVVGNFDSQYGSITTQIENTVKLALRKIGLDDQTINDIKSYIDTFTTIGQATFKIIKAWRENTIQGITQTIIQGVGFTLSQFYDIPLEVYFKILAIAFPEAAGETKPPSPEEAVKLVNSTLHELKVDPDIIKVVNTVVRSIAETRDISSNGYRWIFNQIMDWLAGKVEEIADTLFGDISGKLKAYSLFHLGGNFTLGQGQFSLFCLKYDLAIDAGVNLKTEELLHFLVDVIFEGYDWKTGSAEEVFNKLLSFIEIIPLFKASLGVSGFASKESPFMDMLLGSLGVNVKFEGGGHFVLQLLSFKGGAFERSGFMKVIEWGFYFKIEVSRDFTLFDILTGGVGGGALAKLAEYVGLASITITVSLGLAVEIIKRAASPFGPEQATFTMIIAIGAAISISFLIVMTLPIPPFILPIPINIYGSIKVVFTFIQDLLDLSTPLKIFMDIIAYVKVRIGLQFAGIDVPWGPKTLYHHDFTARNTAEAEEANETMGVDKDHDGLSDEYEEAVPGLKPDSPDSDGDGLTDKEETQTTKTDPTNPDTDGDGLNDYEEIHQYKTNPKRADTDSDGLSDGDEIKIYKTKPTVMDTDEDGLDDYYEVNTIWDISNVTTSVKEVLIGGVAYNDHTDPLDPDTDDDGLLDGEEGPAGPYYGLEDLYNKTAAKGEGDKDPKIFNYGYTHPLDNDTDDDSYLQLWDGTKALVGGRNVFLRSMTDGEEVKGIWVTFIIDGEPHRTLIRTNPCNPDTDGDTGATSRTNVPPDAYLNSDGYELAQNPPTDPTNGDTDHDGLIDGLEGVLSEKSYHTNPNNPDTDGDGLGDMQEILLGTDPRNADTDFDLVLDGDEYHRFHTNPHLADSDYDGLEDYEELFFWHSNPNLRDSDADRICDGQEVLKYDTDPMDEDTDNDGLSDYDEIFKYGINPFNPDTDNDGLRDFEEVKIYLTDPLNWDTDGDSILYPNEYGQMTWPMSDGDEVFKFKTNPARTDTDNDGLSDSIELYLGSGRIPRSVLEPIPLKATNKDTDGDGLLDGQELRIGNTTSIIYPYLALMPYSYYNTSVLLADTDRDGLSDFEEVNGTLPRDRSFEAGVAKFNYTGSLPWLWDTDNDTLSDGDEVFYHGTDPARADTDGDGLLDQYETTMNDTINERKSKTYYSSLTKGGALVPGAPNASFSYAPVRQTVGQPVTFDASTSRDLDGTISTYFWDFGDGTNTTGTSPVVTHTYPTHGTYTVYLTVTDNDGLSSTVKGTVTIRFLTSAINPDTDGDLLPDGYEMDKDTIKNVAQRYGINIDPLNPDANNNGILDGYEIDLDNDGLSDGEEFFVYNTYKSWKKGSAYAGGFLNPDSDGDGLSDGVEVNEFGTDPTRYDTDGDGYSDGAEVAAGTDPLSFTSPEKYQEALDRLRAGRVIRIVYPKNATLTDTTADVRVVNSTFIETMWFRYNDGTRWSNNYTLQYNADNMQWEYTDIVWPEGSYWIQVFGTKTTGYVVWDQQWFTICIEGIVIPFFRGWSIKILSPANATIYDKNVDIRVINATEVVNMWFRYDSGSGWKGNHTLQYSLTRQEWENTTIVWTEGSYHLQVFAYTPSGEVIWDEQWFTIGLKIDWIRIVSPTNTTILDVGVDVLVINSTALDTMWFRYDSGAGWSNNYTLAYNSEDQRWEDTTVVWTEGSHHLQVLATTHEGNTLSDEVWFSIRVEKLPIELPPQLYMLAVGVVIGTAFTSASFLIARRRRRRAEMPEGEGEAQEEGK